MLTHQQQAHQLQLQQQQQQAWQAQQDQFFNYQQMVSQCLFDQQQALPQQQPEAAPATAVLPPPADFPPPPSDPASFEQYYTVEQPEWEEVDYEEELEPSDPLSQLDPLPVTKTDAPSGAEIQATLWILRDTMGLVISPPVTEEIPGCLTLLSTHVVPSTTFTFPIDPEVVQRAGSVASGSGTSALRAKPLGFPLPVTPNEAASVAGPAPIPEDVWDRLVAFKKARVSHPGSSRPWSRKCALEDKVAAETEANLSWMGEAAAYGIEASSLMLYLVEWLLRVERGLIPAQTPEVKLHMLSILAKLQRRSLDQYLRVSLQAVHLRRRHILPRRWPCSASRH